METFAPSSSRRRLALAAFSCYMACLLLAVVWFGLQNLREQGAYNIGDWLINYSGGFIRRGLTGQVVLLLSRAGHIAAARVVLALQICLFAALYAAVWLLARRLRWRLWTIALAFSPATLGFVALVGGGAFRKDLLLLLTLATLLIMLQRGVSDRVVVLHLSATAILIALSHEGLMVYWPYLLGGVAISRQSLKSSVKLGLAPTLLLVALTALVSRYPGNLTQAQAICSSIGSTYAGRDVGLCGGSIAYLGESPAYYRAQVVNSIRTNHYLRDYSGIALLAFLPCVLAVMQMWRIPWARRSVQLLLLWGGAGLLSSLPLFVAAVDWGRWLYLDVFSWMLLLFFTSAQVESPEPLPPLGPRWTVRRSLGTIFLAVYLLCWHVPVTGYEGRGWGYFGMAQRHLQRLGQRPAAQHAHSPSSVPRLESSSLRGSLPVSSS